MNVVKLQKEINNLKLSDDDTNSENTNFTNKYKTLFMANEKLGDAFCSLGLYELGLKRYLEQV